MYNKEKMIIIEIIKELDRIYTNFSYWSKESSYRKLLYVVNKYGYKLDNNLSLQKMLNSDLRDILYIYDDIYESEFNSKASEIKKKIYDVILNFYEKIPLDIFLDSIHGSKQKESKKIPSIKNWALSDKSIILSNLTDENSKVRFIVNELKKILDQYQFITIDVIEDVFRDIIILFEHECISNTSILNSLLKEIINLTKKIIKCTPIKEEIIKIKKIYYDQICPDIGYITAKQLVGLSNKCQSECDENKTLTSKEAFSKAPIICNDCNGMNIEYLDEIDNESIIFECNECGQKYPIKLNSNDSTLYFF